MDKEAQEKILAEFIQQHNHGATIFNSKEMAKGIIELGYRKIEGNPPLLSVSPQGREASGAQRDSDIKWIRGL